MSVSTYSVAEAGRDVKGFRFFSAAELDAAKFSVEYLVSRVLVARQPAVLAGPKKCLKTTIAADLALSLATGRAFLGRFPVRQPVRVGFMSGESGMGTLQETFRRIAAEKKTTLAGVGDRLLVTENMPQFENPAHLKALETWITNNALGVVVIDPAFMCIPGDAAGNLFTMGRLLGGFSGVFRESGCTPVLVHHTKQHISRANPYSPPELEDIAWSGTQEWARQWILLRRRERYEPGSGLHRLWLQAGGSAGHSGLWGVDADEGLFCPDTARIWDVIVHNAKELQESEEEQKADAREARMTDRLRGDMDKVLNAVGCHPDGETKSALKAKSGLRTTRFETALAALVDAGTVEECKVAKGNKQSYDGYRPATQGPDDNHSGHSGQDTRDDLPDWH